MKAIAACVLGGISLLGGSGTIIGAVLGAYFLTQIDSVLVLLRIPAWWNDFIAGLVLLAVLVFDGRLRCALERNIRRQNMPASRRRPNRVRRQKTPTLCVLPKNVRLPDDSFTSLRLGTGARRATDD